MFVHVKIYILMYAYAYLCIFIYLFNYIFLGIYVYICIFMYMDTYKLVSSSVSHISYIHISHKLTCTCS